MARTRFPRSALAAFLAAGLLTAGCGAPHQTVTAIPSSPSAPITSTQTTPSLPPTAAVSGRHGGRGGSTNGSSAAVPALPADWPTDLPIPAGDIIGSTGSAGRWSVQILAVGSAAQVHQSTVAFYTGVGFAAVTDSVLNRGNRQITLVVENRDHSATQTNLVIGVTTR
jgi:hypothetical protein